MYVSDTCPAQGLTPITTPGHPAAVLPIHVLKPMLHAVGHTSFALINIPATVRPGQLINHQPCGVLMAAVSTPAIWGFCYVACFSSRACNGDSSGGGGDHGHGTPRCSQHRCVITPRWQPGRRQQCRQLHVTAQLGALCRAGDAQSKWHDLTDTNVLLQVFQCCNFWEEHSKVITATGDLPWCQQQ